MKPRSSLARRIPTGRVPASDPARSESAQAEISSLSSSLAEIVLRIGELEKGLRSAGDEDRSSELLAVEKSLETAARRLERLQRLR